MSNLQKQLQLLNNLIEVRRLLWPLGRFTSDCCTQCVSLNDQLVSQFAIFQMRAMCSISYERYPIYTGNLTLVTRGSTCKDTAV